MPLYRRPESIYWWYRFKVAGREYRGTTNQTNAKLAAQFERRYRSELEMLRPPGKPRGAYALADLAELDRRNAEMRRRRAPTLAIQEFHWRWLRRHIGDDIYADQINYRIATQYIQARQNDGVRNQTIRRELATLYRGLRLAVRDGAAFRLPDDWPRIESDQPDPKSSGRLHPVEILAEWVAALPEEPRDIAWFVLLTGLRHEEARRVAGTWVVPAPTGIGLPALLSLPGYATKTRQPRIVGLTEQALGIIQRRIGNRPENELVFSQKNYRWSYKAACHTIGYDQTIKLRDLRVAYATLAIAGGADPIAVQAALGHRQLATTQKYLKSTIARTASASVLVDMAVGKLLVCHS